jgi:hypothetical protein
MIKKPKKYFIFYISVLFIGITLSACSEDKASPEKKLTLQSESRAKSKEMPSEKSAAKVNTLTENNNGANAIAQAIGLNEEDHKVLKEDFFCELALTARENCELQPRDELAMELCLKMSSYYTNSRHCGYQP